jgi:molecular chaperone IbpA
MTRIDYSPLFRSSVGFDRMMNLLDAARTVDDSLTGYPPYNIEKIGDDNYRVTIAAAGFAIDDLDIEVKENTLFVRGKAADDSDGKVYLHRGIAGRAFERRFQLADHVKVTGASLDLGLLTIELVHEIPEAMKPRKIEIATSSPAIEDKRAAA